MNFEEGFTEKLKISADSKTASTQPRRDSATLNQPAKRMDSAEYQKEIGKKFPNKAIFTF